MWACDNELAISTEFLSVIIDIVELFIQIIMLVGVNMSVLNVVVVIGCMEVNQQQRWQ
jgi:hypothetical protein